METKIANIAKNTSYFTLALAIQKVISFSYFFILAAFLGKDDLGRYYTAVSFTTIVAMILDFGLANVLTREAAKNPEKAAYYLKATLSIKLALAILACGVGFAVAKMLGYEPEVIFLILISSISMVADALSSTIFAAIRGFHNLRFESISAIMFQAIVLVLGLIAMERGASVAIVLSALAVASVVNAIYAIAIGKRRFNLGLSLEFDASTLKKLIALAWPFALFVFAQRSYTYLDSIMLSRLADYGQVGIYQLAFKLVVALQFLPLAFTASLYPAMSAYWQSNRPQLAVSFNRAISYLGIVALPIAAGVFVLADKILPLIGSGYEEALWPMRISVIALFFIFIGYPIGSLLNACDQQRANTRNMIIVAISSVILNIFLIPRFQATGASLTVLATNILMNILGLIYVLKLIPYRPKDSLVPLGKSLLASFLMAVLVYFLKETFHPVIVIFISAVIYFTLLFVFKAIRKEDIQSIRASISR